VMKKVSLFFAIILVLLTFSSFQATKSVSAMTTGSCGSRSFFGLPTWYKYLKTNSAKDLTTGNNTCDVQIESLSDIWLIVAAVIEALLRVAALLSVVFVMYGGVSYILSQAEPEKTKKALGTIINAVIGLAITIIAASVVSFVASRFG